MIFTELSIAGVYLIELERQKDERGFFARCFCAKEFLAHGLHIDFVQCNLSHNIKQGTVRGMHYQVPPYEEVKIAACIAGAIYDVVLDIRPNSSTYGQWLGIELSAVNQNMIYIPTGIAHGFQTLQDNSTVFYQMGNFYHPEYGRRIRWDDPSFAIKWPLDTTVMSLDDQQYANY